MTTTLSQERFDSDVFITTSEWNVWQQGMLPSGSVGDYFGLFVRGGLAFGLAAVASAAAPSGGTISFTPAQASPAVVAAPAIVSRKRDDESSAEAHAVTAPESTAITADDQVAAIQDALSLSVTQIAGVVGVTRATAYSWINGDVASPRSQAAAQRLRDLYRVARMWRDRSDEQLGRLVAVPLGDDQLSLFDLLATSDWNEAAIDRALTSLAERLAARNAGRRKDRERGLGRVRSVTPASIELERLRLRRLV